MTEVLCYSDRVRRFAEFCFLEVVASIICWQMPKGITMDGTNRQIDSAAFFESMVESQRQREGEIKRKVIPSLKGKRLPTPTDVRKTINSCVGSQRFELLRHHAFSKELQLRTGLESFIRDCIYLS